MASHDFSHRRNQSTPQSIPLQDLAASTPEQQDDYRTHSRRRTLSDRGRDFLRNRNSIVGAGQWTSAYAPITERSPSPTGRAPINQGIRLVTPNLAKPTISAPGNGDFSPTVDGAAFQEAMGFAGLSFQGETPSRAAPSRPYYGRAGSIPSLITHDSDMTLEQQELDSSAYSDTTPLTDRTHLQPASGPEPRTPTGQKHDRRKSSVRFSPMAERNPGGMLGDDLANAEAGLHTPSGSSPRRSSSLKRSISSSSPTSPLQRAGTIVRNMSQRVVNVSNEDQERLVERARRKSSIRHPRPSLSITLPSVNEYTTDGAVSPDTHPVEKTPSPQTAHSPSPSPALSPPPTPSSEPFANPLRGKSLGVFSADNKLRLRLCDLLVHPATEPFILLLIVFQTILLAVDAASPALYNDTRQESWGKDWRDFALLILFVIYTAEIVVRSIVSGFLINPSEYSTINRQVSFRKAIYDRVQILFAPAHEQLTPSRQSSFAPQQSILRSFTANKLLPDQPLSARDQQRVRLAHRAFLRHSFNRLDFLAVGAFWINLVLFILQVGTAKHIAVFRMLSCLRIVRLLSITSGTSVILRSLKKAAPLLVNVAVLIGFFWLLFAIVGVQSFKASLRRSCVWFDPDFSQFPSNLAGNYTLEMQFCGGWLASNGSQMPWLLPDGQNGSSINKGYICPVNSVCIQGDNPYNGTVNFDNIFNSFELVFVIMTSNTFSDLLYYLADSDMLAAALFFAVGIIILYLWLINLLVAVITSSFQVIREESKGSAFTTDDENLLAPHEDEHHEDSPKKKINKLRQLFAKTKPFWIG
ncbi:hypothetical protein LTS18_007736, partial [Coniosporium uncinatum]